MDSAIEKNSPNIYSGSKLVWESKAKLTENFYFHFEFEKSILWASPNYLNCNESCPGYYCFIFRENAYADLKLISNRCGYNHTSHCIEEIGLIIDLVSNSFVDIKTT